MDLAVIQLHNRRENTERGANSNDDINDRHDIDVRKLERQLIVGAVFPRKR